MNNLNDQILAQTLESGLNDYTQRSALGMARMWLEHGEVRTSQQEKGFEKRDALAKNLVTVMLEEGGTKQERIDALARARAKVNEPFLDPQMLGYQAARAKAGAVGSDKKNQKLGLSK